MSSRSTFDSVVKSVQDLVSGIDSRQWNVVAKETKVLSIRDSVQKRLDDSIERGKEFESLQFRKKRRTEALCENIKLKEDNSSANELKTIRELVEKRSIDLEEREKEFKLLQERRKIEFALKEDELNKQLKLIHEGKSFLSKREKDFESFREEKLREIKLKYEEFESLQERRNRERASKEEKMNSRMESAKKCVEALKCVEREFNSFKDLKTRELALKEDELRVLRERLAHEVTSREENVTEQGKFGLNLIEMLDLAQNKLAGMKATGDNIYKEIESREKTLKIAIKTVTATSKRADLISESAKERLKEVVNREEEFRLYQEREMRKFALKEEEFKDCVEKKKDELDCKDRKLAEKDTEITSKEQYVAARENELGGQKKELELKEKNLDSWEKELELKETDLKYWENELEVKEKSLGSVKEEVELKENKLISVQKLYLQRLNELDMKEKNLNSAREFTRTFFEEHLAIRKQLHSEGELIEKRARELDGRFEELERNWRKLVESINAPVQIQPNQSADIHLVLKMDGKTLQMFLNDPEKDLESMSDEEACKVLNLSSNPAKLVLDSMEGFYPPYLREGDVSFKVKRTCIFLLEQLVKMSPVIQPCVSEEAITLARDWKSKLSKNPLEVLGFLYLLAGYNIVSCFHKEDVFSFLKSVARHKKAPELCYVLGFTDKIPGLINDLLINKKRSEAISFIDAFQLANEFQPGEIFRRPEDESIDQKVDTITGVIKCIKSHNLETEHSPKILENIVEKLLMLKEDTTLDETEEQKKPEKKSDENPMAVILANTCGKNLQFFLNEHFQEHKLLSNEVFLALKMSLDAAKLVLDAIEGFHPSLSKEQNTESEVHVIRESCILLLEQLLILAPIIKPEVKEEAQKIAFVWKARRRKNPLCAMGFLLLVANYNLTPQFDVYELVEFYRTAARHRHAPELLQALGISEKIFENRTPDSEVGSQLHDRRLIHKNDVEGSDDVPTFLYDSIDPSKIVLDALRYSNCLKMGKEDNLMKNAIRLMEQLVKFSPGIRSNAKEIATRLAIEWKRKLWEQQLKTYEILGFFQLVVTYNLSSFFLSDELLPLLRFVRLPKKAIALVGLLGLSDKMPNFIQNLIENKQYLLANSYIHGLKLEHMFPVAPLLKEYVIHSRRVEKENHFSKGQHDTIASGISSLKAVIKLIPRNGLESESSTNILTAHLKRCERKRVGLDSMGQVP